MFGNNPIRPPVKSDGEILQVQSIFATFQGEGPYTGWPAVFIRLGGCNLACRFCDTEFESFHPLSIDEIISKTNELSGKANDNTTHKLIVITGGEPFRQPIEQLCDRLIKNSYKIQIETNGTLFRNVSKDVDIICSPKNTGTGYHMIREDLLERVNAFKFIVSAHDSLYSNVGNVGQANYNIPVYVQPMDEQDEQKNRKNMALAIKIAADNGYRISLQTHKILEIE
jgi:7-carboxy-7-deazaguanine synthase